MHSRSHLDPKNSILGWSRQHLSSTSVCQRNSRTSSRRLMPRYRSLSSSLSPSKVPRAFSSARLSWKRRRISTSVNSRWANQALVTTLRRSRSMPKYCGESAMMTTAFCTVERVTSAGRFRSWEASIWRVHEMPKREVASGSEAVAGRRRVK